HVAERGRNAALRGNGVRTGREHLGDAGRAQALLGQPEGGAQAGAAGADDEHVVLVFGDLVGVGHGSSCGPPAGDWRSGAAAWTTEPAPVAKARSWSPSPHPSPGGRGGGGAVREPLRYGSRQLMA